METLEQKQLMTTLSDTLRDNVESHLTDPPYDLLLGSEGATTETEICTAAFPQTCHSTLVEHDGWTWNEDNPFASVDWSGVHLGPKNGVLIAPDILISATHMGSMQIFGRPITFYSPDGSVEYDRDVIDFIDVPGSGDIRVNRLNEPLPDDIATVALPDPDFNLSSLEDALILSLTWEDTTHVNKVRASTNDQNVPYIVGRADEAYPDLFERPSGGDSGTGMFFAGGNSLVAGGILHGGTRRTIAGPYLGTAEIQLGISEAITQLGSTHQFTTVEWGQPAVDAVLASFEIDDTRQGGRRTRTR